MHGRGGKGGKSSIFARETLGEKSHYGDAATGKVILKRGTDNEIVQRRRLWRKERIGLDHARQSQFFGNSRHSHLGARAKKEMLRWGGSFRVGRRCRHAGEFDGEHPSQAEFSEGGKEKGDIFHVVRRERP